MRKPAIINGACRLRGHCIQCREDAHWRAQVGTPEVCPHGITAGTGLGDFVAKVTTALGIPPCGGCKGRIRVLNAAGARLAAKVRKWAS